MNCREAISLLAKEPDAPLDAGARSELAGHLAQCASCHRTAADLAAALGAWRTETARVEVPDPNQEWLTWRRRLRGGETTVAGFRPATRRFSPAWLVMPLAAAAVAIAVFFPRGAVGDRAGLAGSTVARANSVEVPGGQSSMMVFVDDQSGWLIVWASDAGGG